MSDICGIDKHAFMGEVTLYGSTESEQDMVIPSVHGHENSGIVVEINGQEREIEHSGKALKIGDRVMNCSNNKKINRLYYELKVQNPITNSNGGSQNVKK
jgi:D-arabinose 1-dehydrogenase-like Zn-dependent alcohol dehydrogenase